MDWSVLSKEYFDINGGGVMIISGDSFPMSFDDNLFLSSSILHVLSKIIHVVSQIFDQSRKHGFEYFVRLSKNGLEFGVKVTI